MISINNAIVVISNVIVYIVFQTLFFDKVASKQINIILQDKLEIVNMFLNDNALISKYFKKFISTLDVNTVIDISNKQKDEREKFNKELTYNQIGKPLIYIVLGLIILCSISYYKNVWDINDTIILSSVLFAYSTEMMFYYGVASKYVYIGDHSIAHDIHKLFVDRLTV